MDNDILAAFKCSFIHLHIVTTPNFANRWSDKFDNENQTKFSLES